MPEKQQIRSPASWKSRVDQILQFGQRFPNTEFIVFILKKNREKGEQSSNRLKLCINSKQMNMSKRIPWGPAPNAPQTGPPSPSAYASKELCWPCFFSVKTHLPSKSHMSDWKSASLAIPRGIYLFKQIYKEGQSENINMEGSTGYPETCLNPSKLKLIIHLNNLNIFR